MLPRRSASIAIIALCLAAIVALVILSPFALTAIAHFRNDWLQLSNIGQTYGAISAILSSLALGGILASLLYQARDSRIAHEQMTRTFQHDLIRMELDDPALMAAMGAPWNLDIPGDHASLREFLYVQMWVSYYSGNYAIGELSDATVRALAAHEIFRGRAGRDYWAAVGRRQIENSKGRRNRFFRLLDDEYNRMISSGVPPAGPIKVNAITVQRQAAAIFCERRARQIFVAALGMMVGMLAGRFWRGSGQKIHKL